MTVEKNWWLKTSSLLLALAVVAAACGGDDGGTDSATPPPPTAADEADCDETVPGSQINYGIFAPGASLDPAFSSGSLVGGTEIANIYDVLFTYDYEAGTYEPKLAESLESNDDFTQWTLRLREGITYSDGTVLDAQMVSDNMDRFFEQGVRTNIAGYLSMVTDKTVADELTLEMTLEAPFAEFGHAFSGLAGSIANLNAIGDDPDAFGAYPPENAGVGPYLVERNVPGEELVLRARRDYWDGPVCTETLRFVFVPGASATYESFQAGQLDVAFLRDEPVISAAGEAEEGTFFVEQGAGGVVLFNHREGRPTADQRVREAFMLAGNVDVINERAFDGELNAGKSLFLPGSRFYSEEMEEFPTDPDRARELVDEAKADGFDGRIELLCSNAPPAPETALSIEALLESVGFDVELRTLPTTEQIGEVFQNNFDAACWGLNAAASTAHTSLLLNFHSRTPNRTGYSSPEMDVALFEMLAAEGDEVQPAFAEVNRIFNEDAVSFVYGAPREGIVWKPHVEGIVPTTSTVFLFDKAYLKP